MVPTFSVPATFCDPPRGPGDNARHSAGLGVERVSCDVGREVALACVRFTYGRSGTCSAAGYRWKCRSTDWVGPRSAQHCVAGPRSMDILWVD
jgi:hypothetical protein